MVLQIPALTSVPNVFKSSPEAGQVYVNAGSRNIPTNQATGRKPDEYVVDAAGGGDFLTIAEALTALGSSSGTIRVLAGNYLITTKLPNLPFWNE